VSNTNVMHRTYSFGRNLRIYYLFGSFIIRDVLSYLRCITISAVYHHICDASLSLRCIIISAMHHHLCDASSPLRCIITFTIYHHLYGTSSPLRCIITSAMHHHLYVPTGRCRLTSSIVPTDFDASNRRLRFKFDQCACTNCCRRFLR